MKRNPFDVLGLTSNASSRDVRRRIDELTVQSDLGLGPPEVDENVLRTVRQQLEDPVQRFEAELTWLLWTGDGPTLPPIPTETEIRDYSVWLSGRRTELSGAEGLLINHDLAVLDLERFIRNPSQFGALTQALNAWDALLDSSEFWQLVQDRANSRNDARLNSKVVDGVVHGLPEYVLNRALSGLGSLDVGDTKRLLDTVRTLQVSESFKQLAIGKLVGEHQSKLLGAVQELSEAVRNIHQTRASDAETHRAIEHALAVFRSRVVSQLESLKTLDSKLIDDEIADELARVIARLAEAVGYISVQYPTAVALMQFAIAHAKRPSVVKELVSDDRKLRRNYFIMELNKASSREDIVGVIALLEVCATYCDPDERQNLEEQARQIRLVRRDLPVQAIKSRKVQVLNGLQSGSIFGPNATIQSKPISSAPSPVPASQTTDKREYGRIFAVAAMLLTVAIGAWYFTNGDEEGRSSAEADIGTSTALVVANGQPAPSRTPRPSVTPTQTSTNQGRGKAVFSEQFGVSCNGYEIAEDSRSRTYCEANALVIGVSHPNLTTYFQFDERLPEKFSLSIDMMRLAGSDGSGLLVLGVSQTGHPVLSIRLSWGIGSEPARWELWEHSGQASQSSYVSGGDVERPLEPFAKLEIMGRGNGHFWVLIDDFRVGSFTHASPDLMSGFGFGVSNDGASAGSEMLVKFDNLTVYDRDG